MSVPAEYALLTAVVAATVGVLGHATAGRDAVTPGPLPAVVRQVAPAAEPVHHPRDLPVDAVGDPSSARHVVVLVPGTGADAVNHPSLVRRAADLADEMRAHDRSVAVVAWTGYRAPRHLGEAAGDAHALRGALRLQRFLTRLHAAHEGDAHVTVVGHSYGALVAARAAASGAPMRRLVVVGAPGFGRPYRTVADLGRPDIEVWSAMTHDDPIDLLHRGGDVTAAHGGDTTSERSGALRLPTDAHAADDVTRPGSSGHSGYFDVGSAGLANLARVAVGADAVPDPTPHRRPAGPP